MDSEDNGSQEDQVSKVLKPPCYKIIILGESGVGMIWSILSEYYSMQNIEHWIGD